jgi:Type VI secretion, TssG
MNHIPNAADFPFDIRATVVGRLLAQQNDLNPNQILFKPTQYYQRWGRRDVLSVEAIADDDEINTICLEVSHEGMYDILPEGLFLHPEDDYEDNLKRIQAFSQQEAAGRKFLLPFEQMFYWLRVENEFREARLETQADTWWQEQVADATPLLLPQNPEDAADAAERETIKILMLPYLTEIVGNWSVASQWLSLFLKTEVQIQEIPPPTYDLSEAHQKRLGEGTLGEDFILGTTFWDGIPAVQILLQQLTAENISQFLPKNKQRIILEEELLALLLPIETHYEIELGVEVPSTDFYLDDARNSNILGYTTTI